MTTHQDFAQHPDEAVLAIVEALRGYFVAHADDGYSHQVLAQRWFDEQLFRPTQEEIDRALRMMDKTQWGHLRIRRSDSSLSSPSDQPA